MSNRQDLVHAMTGEGKTSGADPRQYYIAAGTEDAKLVRCCGITC